MKVYIAGPMRGIFLYNFPAFDTAEEFLRADGHGAFNPANIDREQGFHPEDLPINHDWSLLPCGMDLRDVIHRDLDALLKCDAIYLLPGWQRSVGATAERAVALWAGLEAWGHTAAPYSQWAGS